MEFSPMAYLVRASLDNRLGLSESQKVADHLLNQVGVKCGEYLEDLKDFFRAIELRSLDAHDILEAYQINPEMIRISKNDIERILLFGSDHFRTVAARKEMPIEAVLDLDHTMTFMGEEAWKVALKSALEAYVEICKNSGGEMPPNIEELRLIIFRCRAVLEIAVFEQVVLQEN